MPTAPRITDALLTQLDALIPGGANLDQLGAPATAISSTTKISRLKKLRKAVADAQTPEYGLDKILTDAATAAAG